MPERARRCLSGSWGLAAWVILAAILCLAPAALAAEEGEEGEENEDQGVDPPKVEPTESDEYSIYEELPDGVPLPPPAAEPAPAAEETPPAAEEKPKEKMSLIERYRNRKPLFGVYGEWIRFQENLALDRPLWGGSATAPEGYLIGMVGWGTLRPYKRFDEDRKLTEILPVLEFDDPFGGDGKFMEFDFHIQGKGQGFLFALFYGVTDRLMIGFSTQFVTTDLKFDPIFIPGTIDKLGVASLEDCYRLLELLGRPRPKTRYKTEGLDFGDTTLQVTWNYFRNDFFSTALTGSVNIPTAHTADPNENLVFGLGPDFDTGNGAWGAGLNLPFDFKLPDPVGFLSFSITAEGMYFAPAPRRSPTFLPINQDVRDYIEAQGVDVDLFQDLSDMDDYYTYTPGPWAAVSGGIGIGPVGISYRHGWAWEAAYHSNSPGFAKMVDEIGLVGENDDGKVTASVSLPLTPLYIPALAQFRFEYQTDGRNTLVFRDRYSAGLGFLLPVAVPERYKFKRGAK